MSNNISFELRQQMIEDKITSIASTLNVNNDTAFMRLAYSILFDKEFDDPDYDSDVVDGGGDKQIDIIHIEEDEDQATIHFVQVKNKASYEGSVVALIRDGLDWSFKQPQNKYRELVNKDLVLKIENIRDLSSRLGLKKLNVTVHFVAKGQLLRLSPDFKQEVQHTKDTWGSTGEFKSFDFKVWDVNGLVDKLNETEQIKKRVDVNLPIYVDVYEVSFSKYRTEAVASAICTVSGSEIAKLVEDYGASIFEQNVRTYLGKANKKNSEIYGTCTKDESAEYFWFYNNGITVTCDEFDIVHIANPPIIKITNMQIVNGCQTSTTLAEAAKDGKLSPKTRVLLKVFATKEPSFVDKITRTTNSQSAVSSRDLRSNDMYQRDLERLLKARSYYYERKPKMFSKLSKGERKKIISNEKLGQAHLAVVQHLPATAMAQTDKIWSTHYDIIYNSKVNELLASYLVYNYCVQKRKEELKGNITGLEQLILKYGTFHLSRILGNYLGGEYWKRLDDGKLNDLISTLETDAPELEQKYNEGRALLKQIIDKLTGGDISRLTSVFKSNEIQKELDSYLRTTTR